MKTSVMFAAIAMAAVVAMPAASHATGKREGDRAACPIAKMMERAHAPRAERKERTSVLHALFTRTHERKERTERKR